MNAPRLLDDPYLAPYAAKIFARRARARACNPKDIVGGKDAHYFGLHRSARAWVFREWAPHATAIYLVGDFSKWRRQKQFQLRRLENGIWEGCFPKTALKHGDYYRLDVCWEGGEGERIPAYAQRVVQDPETKLFSAQVWAPKRKYVWKNPSPPRTKAGPLIYEAHVGMATEEEKVGSYVEFRRTMLPRIKKAGYDTVQLMGIMEHPYYGSFGYHVSSFFAASSRFGTPEDLKALIDAAHGMGLSVIMDLIHSHAVKNERDGLSCFDGTPWQYFHAGGKGYHRAWDSRCFDYAKSEVLRFLLANCKYWLEEYHFDGFRFDGVTSMLYWDHGLGANFTDYGMYFGGNTDEDAVHYLMLANCLIHFCRPDAITIAEDVSGMPGCASPVEEGGLGFDYRMAMGIPDFWFRLAEKVRDEAWPMGGLWWALTDKRADEKTVSYVESHDQALVGGKSFFFQLVDDAIYNGMGVNEPNLRIARGMALHKMARLATLATAQDAYLAFMGNEFGHPEWIDFPRAENGWSYHHARRQWSLRQNPALRFKALGDFDEVLLGFVGKHRRGKSILMCANEPDHVLAFMRDECLYVFNFDATHSYTGYGVMVPPGKYRLQLDTDEVRFGGEGRLKPRQVFTPQFVQKGNEMIPHVMLYLPARTALVLRRMKRGK